LTSVGKVSVSKHLLWEIDDPIEMLGTWALVSTQLHL